MGRSRRVSGSLLHFVFTALLLAGCVTNPIEKDSTIPVARGALFEYPYFKDQATGIAMSARSRIFVNFPRWDKDPLYSVAELLPDATLRPYPDHGWNRWGKDEATHPERHFVCVQSVFVDSADFLWILDPASPAFKGVVAGGAKLVRVNTVSDMVEQVIPLDAAVVGNSYLNDVRIDRDRQFAYITDSGAGAIVVVDLASGAARRRLERNPSTKADPAYVPVIEGRELRGPDGRVPQIHADGLALDSKGEYLYYHALTASTLYRIRTSALKDNGLSEEELGRQVEKVAETGAVDGMVMDDRNNIYLTALEENAIKRYQPASDTLEIVVQDDYLQWPDSLAISPDDYLYITASQINRMPRFNNGKDRRMLPYKLFKIWLAPL